MKEKCLVIGGAGFIGKHVVDCLLQNKRQVIVLGRKLSSQVHLPDKVTYISHDYNNENFLLDVLEGITEVICLAYATNPATSFADPVGDFMNNLSPSIQLFKAASQKKLKKLVIISSGGAVYGLTNQTKIKEIHETNPISPYGITKLTIEKYALMYHKIYHLPVIIVRPSNSYGPGQKPFTGQGFVATAIGSILSGKKVTIFGNKGTIRDYVYVTDLAEGMVAAMEHGKNGSCYNLSSGIGKNNLEVLRQISLLAVKSGFNVKIKALPKRPFDVGINVLDSSALTKDTGWKIKTSFDQGIKLTWDWYINNQAKWL